MRQSAFAHCIAGGLLQITGNAEKAGRCEPGQCEPGQVRLGRKLGGRPNSLMSGMGGKRTYLTQNDLVIAILAAHAERSGNKR